MLFTVYTVLILLLLLPLLAEVRMVIRSMLFSALGKREGARRLKALPFLRRVTMTGVKSLLAEAGSPHLRPYGQYMKLQLLSVLAAVCAVALEALCIRLRLAVPALLVCIVFCVGAFAGISLVHAHAGYDPVRHTTRYDRAAS